MMTCVHTARPVLRFRRWCRKGYAVFCSLGKCVTIGTLKKGIADRSLGKQAVCTLGTSMMCLYPASDSVAEVVGADPWELSVGGIVAGSCSLFLSLGSVGLNQWAVQLLNNTSAQLSASVADGMIVLFLFKLIKDREDAVPSMLPVFFLPIRYE